MVSRRKQTSLPSEQPVRFYKVIALTFLFVTLVLFGAVLFMSSKRAVITLETKATPIDISNNVVVGQGVDNPQIAAIVTTTVVVATETFSPIGSKEEEGVATGLLTIHNEGPVAQPLIVKTRFQTTEGVLFRLRERVVVPANGTVEAEVYADKPGKESEIGPSRFFLPALNEAKQKIIYATSDKAMAGGIKKTGVVSQADFDEAEKRLTTLLEEQIKKQLSGVYPGKETAVSLLEVNKKNSAKVGEVVSSVTIEGRATVAVVAYDKAELKVWADKNIQNRAVDDAEIVRGSSADPKVTLKEYNEEKKQATLHVFLAGTATINPQSKQLEKSVFFGKTRDEAKRYLMSLEHVSNAKVDFRPFWMQTVPHIHDHVQVIVKEVQ